MFFDGLVCRKDFLGRFCSCRIDRSFCRSMTIELLKNITRPFQWNMLFLVQVHHLRFRFHSVLHSLSYSIRKLSAALLPTTRTALYLRLMFGHFHAHFRKVKDLSFFAPLHPLLL